MPRAFLKLFAMLSFGISMWAQTAAVPGEPPADLDAFVANSMKTFDVPGMAVTIVKDGKIGRLPSRAQRVPLEVHPPCDPLERPAYGPECATDRIGGQRNRRTRLHPEADTRAA